MRRRHFLMTSGALATASALPFLSLSAKPAAAEPQFLIARLDSARGTFVAARDCASSACASTHVRLHFDAFHVAESAPVLHALRVQALFDVPGSPRTPYIAWDFRSGRSAGNSGGVSFVAGRECLRGLALDYQLGGDDAAAFAHCALTGIEAPLLQPGHYVLAGPSADGRAADLDNFDYSGATARPLLAQAAKPRAFDYLAFRVEALA